MNCRFCASNQLDLFVDLGHTAIANAFVLEKQLYKPEAVYPLKVFVCRQCRLVQVDEYEKVEYIFSQEYVYFSSVSKHWLEHCRQYAQKATKLFGLSGRSLVVEIASNDGYLLKNFKQAGIPCLGIEPTQSTADQAIRQDIETFVEFFGTALAQRLAAEGRQADLLIGNNVLAHVPNLNDFVAGLKLALKPTGVITMEFPHLHRLIQNNEFDTIYHEHYSYFSFLAVQRIFRHHELEIFDVEELPTHGGSLRIYAKHVPDCSKPIAASVGKLLDMEKAAGVDTPAYYQGIQHRIHETKNTFLHFLIGEKMKGRRIIGFGAAAKGNTFLNYCGIKSDLIEFVVDETPIKQGKFLPQSHIPVVGFDRIAAAKPDLIVILPWNFKNEIVEKLAFARQWGARFVTYIPKLEVIG
ncbi:MAG: methyltransferase domain-containing protein [Verrucomicrobia bacterium]|nr:methyltransferase domain-containing protein [Verrucomicrobiota bacterium]